MVQDGRGPDQRLASSHWITMRLLIRPWCGWRVWQACRLLRHGLLLCGWRCLMVLLVCGVLVVVLLLLPVCILLMPLPLAMVLWHLLWAQHMLHALGPGGRDCAGVSAPDRDDTHRGGGDVGGDGAG